jgi:hypothetical protein
VDTNFLDEAFRAYQQKTGDTRPRHQVWDLLPREVQSQIMQEAQELKAEKSKGRVQTPRIETAGEFSGSQSAKPGQRRMNGALPEEFQVANLNLHGYRRASMLNEENQNGRSAPTSGDIQ